MIVTGGKLVYSCGDLAQACYLASARKSILSTLYDKHVAKGTIDLDKTMAGFGIDDVEGLLPVEKTAKVRDLVLSAIFEKATGKTVFAGLDEDIAKPLQFQDFQVSRQTCWASRAARASSPILFSCRRATWRGSAW